MCRTHMLPGSLGPQVLASPPLSCKSTVQHQQSNSAPWLCPGVELSVRSARHGAGRHQRHLTLALYHLPREALWRPPLRRVASASSCSQASSALSLQNHREDCQPAGAYKRCLWPLQPARVSRVCHHAGVGRQTQHEPSSPPIPQQSPILRKCVSSFKFLTYIASRCLQNPV